MPGRYLIKPLICFLERLNYTKTIIRHVRDIRTLEAESCNLRYVFIFGTGTNVKRRRRFDVIASQEISQCFLQRVEQSDVRGAYSASDTSSMLI